MTGVGAGVVSETVIVLDEAAPLARDNFNVPVSPNVEFAGTATDTTPRPVASMVTRPELVVCPAALPVPAKV